jgi:hypothetical protein
VAIKHSFVSTIPDDPAAVTAGEVTPTNWNDNHKADTPNAFLMSDPSGDLTEATVEQTKITLEILVTALIFG